jgi:hypothetical protein
VTSAGQQERHPPRRMAFFASGAEISKCAVCSELESQIAFTGRIGIRLPWYHQSKLASRSGSL